MTKYLAVGKDATDFFHRMTTQDIKSLKENEVRSFCLLNEKALIQTYGHIKKSEQGFEILSQDEELISKFEKFIFSEDLEIKKLISENSSSQEKKGKLEYEDFFQDYNPFELLLDESIKPLKGCYPGQEVIERMLSRKIEPAKKLIFLNLNFNPSSTQIIRIEDEAECGKILKVLKEGNDFFVLAVVRKDQAIQDKKVLIETKECSINIFNKE